jgi:hypothetical protein
MSTRGKQADLGLNHGIQGKGDKNRTNNNTAFEQNFSGIDFHEGEDCGFERVGLKWVKRYGTERKPVGVFSVGINIH